MTNDPHAADVVLQAGAPLETADLAMVLLHGRGGSAEDILELGSALHLPNVAYVAPQAAGHTWYPLSFLAPRNANEPYLSSALVKIESVVHNLEQSGLGRERIVVAGFSQGACLATEFVASHPARYGGLIALTGGLIGPPGSLQSSPPGELKGTPALLSQRGSRSACPLGTGGRISGDIERHGCSGHNKALPRSAPYGHAGRVGACPQLAFATRY